MSESIYLDYQATTPLDPRVAAAMQPFMGRMFGNPHSEHTFGWEAGEGVDRAAEAVAYLIGAAPGEIVFTSGATEANNMAIQGVARSRGRRGNHIVTTAIEHKCVLHTALSFQRSGFDVDVVPVLPNGLVDPETVTNAVRDETALVSVMLANNEIGTLQPIAEIGAFCRAHGIVMHTDAAQAVGKVPVDVSALNVDLLSLSAHKLYGPKGIGALYVSRQCPVALEPLIIGGAQQNGLRAGTIPTLLAVGLGEACRLADAELETDRRHSQELREGFLAALKKEFPDLAVNGDLEHRLPGNLNIRFAGVDSESLLTALQGQIAASTGSACNAGSIEPSYVLLALGLSIEDVNSSIRFGFGRFICHSTVLEAATLIGNKARSLAIA
jgi:cysteine desulfurase